MIVVLPLLLAACGSEPVVGDDGTELCPRVGTDEGDCAQDFELAAADGSTFSLADTAGQRVVLVGAAEW